MDTTVLFCIGFITFIKSGYPQVVYGDIKDETSVLKISLGNNKLLFYQLTFVLVVLNT